MPEPSTKPAKESTAESQPKWRKVVLSDADIAAGKHAALKAAFRTLYHNQGCPRDAGMYQLLAKPTEYLFPPAAWSMAWTLLESYGAVECSAPAKSDVEVLVTHPVSSEVCFASNSD